MQNAEIKAIIGLGNPGSKYEHTRHNIGFRVVDALCQRLDGAWVARDTMEVADSIIAGRRVLLIKPQTFMNASGKVIPWLTKQGIKCENILVVHDELEKPFGNLSFKMGGSARGHNGLRSIIESCGPDFLRLRFGIGRPQEREQVGDYVLEDFTESDVDAYIAQAVEMVEKLFS